MGFLMDFSKLPSVEKLVQSVDDFGVRHSVRVQLARTLISKVRNEFKKSKNDFSPPDLKTKLLSEYEKLRSVRQRRVINGTGVILHTNLGRAPLGNVLKKMEEELSGYSSLEMDLHLGVRGERTGVVEYLLTLLTGAEASVVVNNNAASLFLALHTFSHDREVIVSRGELVQIGGGFRIPDILSQTHAFLKEVGTTNITKLKDYEKAISKETSIILKVHRSNFSLKGHTESPPLEALLDLSRKKKILFFYDLGSGLLNAFDQFKDEPDVFSLVRSKVPLIAFSTDKLLGASQGGILLGDKKWIDPLKKSPLYRALRIGKLDLFVLEEILRREVFGETSLTRHVIELKPESLEKRARNIISRLSEKVECTLEKGASSSGGGTLPEVEIPSILIKIPLEKPDLIAQKLRRTDPPVVVRVEKKSIIIDLRTVFENEDELLLSKLKEAL